MTHPCLAAIQSVLTAKLGRTLIPDDVLAEALAAGDAAQDRAVCDKTDEVLKSLGGLVGFLVVHHMSPNALVDAEHLILTLRAEVARLREAERGMREAADEAASFFESYMDDNDTEILSVSLHKSLTALVRRLRALPLTGDEK